VSAGEGVAVGIDLGGTNLRGALVRLDAHGEILDEQREPLVDRTPEVLADRIAALVERFDPGGLRIGVGVGLAAMLRGDSGVVSLAPNLGWRDVDFRAMLRARLGPSVQIYNDLKAITWGETMFGAARGARDVLCLFVGTGIGSGIVTDGKLYFGGGGLAGEIGHTKVVPSGRLCGCGQRGCLEAYASGRNIQARAREELGAGERSLAISLAGSIEAVHAGHLDEAARTGDSYATRLWSEVSLHLGTAIANAVTILDPSKVVLGGGVWEKAPALRERTLAIYRTAVNAPSGERTTLADAVLGDNAGVLGAASLIAG
jgi:glucokinase